MILLTPEGAFHQRLLDLRQRAEASPIPMSVLYAALENPGSSPYAPEGQTLDFDDLRVTLTLEYQPFGLARHVSISQADAPRPNLFEVDAVMKVLGFNRSVEALAQAGLVYLEHGERQAVNIIEPVNALTLRSNA